MKTYIEIIDKSTKEVVKRLDVTGKSDRSIDRCEMGMNINLNSEKYYTQQNTTENELPII